MKIVLAIAFVALATSCADVQCKLNSDCANMEHCSAQNTCVTECRAQRDCLTGQVCTDNGVCVASADGSVGVDAAVNDVPLRDVAQTDSTMDVPTVTDLDAGADTSVVPPTDTGVDVGPLDSGTDVPVDNPSTDMLLIVQPDVPVDTGIDVPMDTGVDVPAPDVHTDVGTVADAGPVAVGVYSYTGVEPPAGMVDPVAVVWHPSGAYALILTETNNIYRYTAATHAVALAAMATGNVGWRMGAFTHDGTTALLIGSTYNTSTSDSTGHLYTWTDATSVLAEQTAEQWTGGSYQSIRFSPDGSQAALLGQGNQSASVSTIWFVSTAGHRTGIAAAQGMAPETGCSDICWTTDGFGAPALDMVCGLNTAGIYRVTDLGSSLPVFTIVASAGETGNVSSIAGTPGGSIELTIGSSSGLYRMTGGVWSVGFDSPTVARANAVSFNDIGTRAFAFGGAGYLNEYRTDVYTMAGITTSQIPISGMPWLQPSGASLNDVQWRPGCDEGLAVGGEDTFEGTSSFIAYFAAMNGRMCH